MESKSQKRVLNSDSQGSDVISMRDNHSWDRIMPHRTFTVNEILSSLKSKALSYNSDLIEGAPCAVLSVDHGWQEGNIKIAFVFEPKVDEPQIFDEGDSSGSESPLDLIRQDTIES